MLSSLYCSASTAVGIQAERFMPRQPTTLTGVAQTVIQRGNEAALLAEDDYRSYLEHLSTGADRHGCNVRAYSPIANQCNFYLDQSSRRPVSTQSKCFRHGKKGRFMSRPTASRHPSQLANGSHTHGHYSKA